VQGRWSDGMGNRQALFDLNITAIIQHTVIS
jgi:hypothetical protein